MKKQKVIFSIYAIRNFTIDNDFWMVLFFGKKDRDNKVYTIQECL